MDSLLSAPVAKFLELNLPLHELLVLARGVIHVFARAAPEADKFFGKFSLCHSFNKVTERRLKVKISEPEKRVELLSTPYHGVVLPLNYSGECLLRLLVSRSFFKQAILSRPLSPFQYAP